MLPCDVGELAALPGVTDTRVPVTKATSPSGLRRFTCRPYWPSGPSLAGSYGSANA